jgi:glutamate carboxypeptidase
MNRPERLDASESRVLEAVEASHADAMAFLERVVRIGSGTFRTDGVREVGREFERELDRIGFASRWHEMPEAMRRAGHLEAVRAGDRTKGRRLLLLGHLDTVFEGEEPSFRREGDRVRGPGITDMKGGDVAILFAVRALAACGLLDRGAVTIFLTGDEENPGSPIEIARRDLVEAARRSDVALGFEPDSGRLAIGRRGLSTWTLEVSAASGHSATTLRSGGAGAAYEAARTLDSFRGLLDGRANVTLNPGLLLAGTSVAHDAAESAGSAAGKFNVIAREARATGDLRFVEPAERAEVQARMREIAAASLPGTVARLEFHDFVPGWPATDASREILGVVDRASRDLGYGPVEADNPGTRGFGDFNFIGSLVPGADGLGVRGRGEHSPDEAMEVASLLSCTARAAVVISRLLRTPD